jgi:hypothetical protein
VPLPVGGEFGEGGQAVAAESCTMAPAANGTAVALAARKKQGQSRACVGPATSREPSLKGRSTTWPPSMNIDRTLRICPKCMPVTNAACEADLSQTQVT